MNTQQNDTNLLHLIENFCWKILQLKGARKTPRNFVKRQQVILSYSEFDCKTI